MAGRSWWIARVAVNTLIGAVAGALPAAAWMAREELTGGFRNGFGGIAWLIALATGTLLGAVAGGALGAFGQGVRVVGLGTVARTLLLACTGAVLGAVAAWPVFGLGDDQAVVAVLVAETAGIVLGMILPGILSRA